MRLTDLDAGWDRPFRRPAFYLRFELGGEFSVTREIVPRVIQAFDRARAIADAVFQPSVTIVAVLASLKPSTKGFAELTSIGFNESRLKRADDDAHQAGPAWRARFNPTDDDPEAPELCWRAIDLQGDRVLRDTLIWNSIAIETRLRPKAAAHAFLVDFERGLMMDVYDDRGMDVFATDPQTVVPVYQQFNGWLLDYDRPRIDRVMKPLISH